MHAIDPNRTALVVGMLAGGWHFCWSALVALGWAQAIIDFVFWVHFIKPIYVIEPFEIARSAILIAVTAVLGAAVGYCFAALWNRIHR